MGAYYLIVLLIAPLLCVTGTDTDKPCAARPVSGRSVICSCNETYCDTITRVSPLPGTFVVYTSSEGGLRFNKSVHNLQEATDKNCTTETLIINERVTFQTIEGFGGAIPDSTGINWKNLSIPLQKHLINSYFSSQGLEYSTVRVPIGGTDFSTHPYAYNESPANDPMLTNFTLAYEDNEYKIPMIKEAMSVATRPIHVLAATWSPPPWMKTRQVYTGYSRLKPEYYQTYADYHVKFIDRYTNEGIPIWGISTTNEPTNGLTGLCFGINCLGWSANDMGKWIVENLGPTIRSSKFKNTKILAGDDQRITIPYWMNLMVKEHPKVLDYIDGVGIHYYTDFISPTALLTELTKFYPGKFIMSTEACQGSMWFIKHHVDFGSWKRAKSYVQDIISDLNHDVVGWIDWNMCLNYKGGPTWAGNYVDSPIIVFPSKGVFIKQPMFYAMGHFSKFVPRGSKRVQITGDCGLPDSIANVAFLTPDNTIAVVLYNDNKYNKTINIKLGTKIAVVEMLPQSVSTVEISLVFEKHNIFWNNMRNFG